MKVGEEPGGHTGGGDPEGNGGVPLPPNLRSLPVAPAPGLNVTALVISTRPEQHCHSWRR